MASGGTFGLSGQPSTHQQQASSCDVQPGNELQEGRVDIDLPSREGALVVWEQCHARPLLLPRGAKCAEDPEQLVNLRVTREQSLGGELHSKQTDSLTHQHS